MFGLIRAVIFGGRHGTAGVAPAGTSDARRTRFESRFHGTFEDWHRQAHDGAAEPSTGPATPPAGPVVS